MDHRQALHCVGFFTGPLLLVLGGSLATVALTSGGSPYGAQAAPAPTVTVTAQPSPSAAPLPRPSATLVVQHTPSDPQAAPGQDAAPGARTEPSGGMEPEQTPPRTVTPPSDCTGRLAAVRLLGNCALTLGGSR